MSFELIKNKLIQQTHQLDALPWNEVQLMLVVNFNSGTLFGARKNLTDIHIDNSDRPRNAKGKPISHKAHIDLTSGKDLLPGYDPVLDFFSCTAGMKRGEKREFRTLLDISNLKSLGRTKNFNEKSQVSDIESKITLNKLEDRNESGNPSIQLLGANDIRDLRILLGCETSLVMLLFESGLYFALGLRNDQEIINCMIGLGGYKSKRVFVKEESENLHPTVITPPKEKGVKATQIDSSNQELRDKIKSKRPKKIFTEPKPKEGYLYAVINEKFDGWVKIGLTTQHHENRLASYQTYAPTVSPFKMPYTLYTENCHVFEKRVHTAIAALGYTRDREWFKIELEKAIEIMGLLKL